MNLQLDFLTAGCNNETGTLDQYNGRILFASGRNVCIANIPEEAGQIPQIITTLPDAPKGRIHACQWIKRNKTIIGALTAADDGTVSLYSIDNSNNNNISDIKLASNVAFNLNMLTSFTLPSAVILASQTFDNRFITVATAKGEIYFFSIIVGDRHIESVNLVGSIKSFAPKKITALAVGILPGTISTPFIMAALSDSSIKLLLPTSAASFDAWKEELTINGHQNWITSLSINNNKADNFSLVLSSSLDKTIRVWKLFVDHPSTTPTKPQESLFCELIPQRNHFANDGVNYRVMADSLALGHENAVFFAHFIEIDDDNENFTGDDKNNHNSSNTLQILSGSSDRSLILWSRASGDEAWRSTLQLGDLNGSLGTIGTDHTFTFYGGSVFLGKWIVAAASTGSILFWSKSSADGITWIPQIPITGHTSIVESINWCGKRDFVVSCSKDQTTRIFSPSKEENSKILYREIARPQIHGYDLKCVAVIEDPETGYFQLLSGADEKIVRVFAAPKQFYCKLGMMAQFSDEQRGHQIPEAAELPALGLSNKTRSDGKDGNEHITTENEGDLVRNSLWPETDKLYGHNQEISTLSISDNREFLATAAKSHLVADAAIRIWIRSKSDSKTLSNLSDDATFYYKWIPSAIIPAHNLTVSSLSFSNNSGLLLSTSRDRHFCLIAPESAEILLKQEAHSRMIFAADWVDDRSFLTGSRDKTVKFWSIHLDNSNYSASLQQTLTFENGITALAVFNASLLAVGDEIGNIFFYHLKDSTWQPLEDVNIKGGGAIGPADAITDLKWKHNNATAKLAVASADNSVRILSFKH